MLIFGLLGEFLQGNSPPGHQVAEIGPFFSHFQEFSDSGFAFSGFILVIGFSTYADLKGEIRLV